MSQILWLIFNAFFAGRLFYIIGADVYPESEGFYMGCLVIHIIGICVGAAVLWVDLPKGKS